MWWIIIMPMSNPCFSHVFTEKNQGVITRFCDDFEIDTPLPIHLFGNQISIASWHDYSNWDYKHQLTDKKKLFSSSISFYCRKIKRSNISTVNVTINWFLN